MNATDLIQYVLLCCVSALAVLSLLASLGFLRRKKEDPDMPSRRSTFAAFTPKPSVLPFVRDTPRVYVIRNNRQGRSVRSVGYNYQDALGRLGWDEKDCNAVDFGPTSKEPSMLEYQTPVADPNNPRSAGDEAMED